MQSGAARAIFRPLHMQPQAFLFNSMRMCMRARGLGVLRPMRMHCRVRARMLRTAAGGRQHSHPLPLCTPAPGSSPALASRR